VGSGNAATGRLGTDACRHLGTNAVAPGVRIGRTDLDGDADLDGDGHGLPEPEPRSNEAVGQAPRLR